MKSIKKRLITIVLALTMMLGTAMPALALTAEEKMKNINLIADLMKQYSLGSSEKDDPFMNMFKNLLEDDEFYNQFTSAMLSQYDRYSMFVPAGDYETTYPSNDSYVGIGVTLTERDGSVVISEVNPSGSALAAGLKAGDIIMEIDGVNHQKSNITDCGAAMRGEQGTKVTIKVNRNGEAYTYSPERKYIGVPNFTSKIVEPGVFYMDFTRFADLSTYLQFIYALQDMVKSNSRSLILDLRGNPGGDVNMALNVINRLLPQKTTYFMSSVRNGTTPQITFYESDGIGAQLNKVIILQDEGTASASEMIVASLYDLGYAVTVGEKTYGKARGQYHLMLEDGSAAVITSMELMAPYMPDYDGRGIEPMVKVANEVRKDENGNSVLVDHQYEEALRIASEYAAKPQQYSVDELGNFTNNK